jgi:hypothetical protein
MVNVPVDVESFVMVTDNSWVVFISTCPKSREDGETESLIVVTLPALPLRAMFKGLE